ncbi:MAG: DNA primase [Candidatus Omnitrophota bacterium]
MAMRIPENILEDILSRIDIVELISSYIPLKKAGRNFKANCPFHHEKTPSFTVSPDRQIYHCFGCGESGNAFKFLMRHERMDFPEAVEALAKKAGVILPAQESAAPSRQASLNERLYKVNELALEFYEGNLYGESGAACRAYLGSRGIKPKTAREFRLGFATSRWDGLITYLRSKNVALSLMEKAGLILPKDSGGYYDRFRNRVIFPIFDIRSRLIGFGGRVMDSSLPKYMNSPETAVYTKGKNLFGLSLSKDHIRKNDLALIVEGYMDFILPFQEGVNNLVASQGTALTADQIRLLKRYTHNVVMIYDGDSAGEMATLRGLDMFVEEGMAVKVVPLPKDADPDVLVRRDGPDCLRDKINNAVSLFDFKLKVLKNRHDIKDAHGKSRIAEEMLFTIGKIGNAILRAEYIKRLSEELGVSEGSVLEELKKLKAGPPSRRHDADSAQPPARSVVKIHPAEKLLIKFMLEEKELAERIMQELSPSDFADERTAKVFSLMHDLCSQGKNVEPSVLMNYFGEDTAGQIVCESMFMPDLLGQEREKAVRDCITRIKVQRLRSKREQLHLQIKDAQSVGDKERLGVLFREFHNLLKKGD